MRFFKGLGQLSLLIMLASCATNQADPTLAEIQSLREENRNLKDDIQNHHDRLTVNLKELLREELLPEIQGLSYVPKDIRNKQMDAKTSVASKVVVGRVEWVTVKSNGMKVKARVDTGAQTSSMHAENIVEKEIDGKKYVQFESTDDVENKKHVFLKEIVKSQRVRSSNGSVSRRFVVKMTILLGTQEHTINVNLNDREDLQYNFLIGRNLLMGKYAVDVSQTRLLGK